MEILKNRYYIVNYSTDLKLCYTDFTTKNYIGFFVRSNEGKYDNLVIWTKENFLHNVRDLLSEEYADS